MSNTLTWEQAKENHEKFTGLIEEMLEKYPPKRIADVLTIVFSVDADCMAIPNYNDEGQYCQLLLYPSKKWNTWPQTSMSISKYNLYG